MENKRNQFSLRSPRFSSKNPRQNLAFFTRKSTKENLWIFDQNGTKSKFLHPKKKVNFGSVQSKTGTRIHISGFLNLCTGGSPKSFSDCRAPTSVEERCDSGIMMHSTVEETEDELRLSQRQFGVAPAYGSPEADDEHFVVRLQSSRLSLRTKCS